MSVEGTPQVALVPVKRYDVNLTLDDLLTPLTQTAAKLTLAGTGAAANPELAQHMQTLSELATQIKDVVGKINQIDPTMLAPTAQQPPTA